MKNEEYPILHREDGWGFPLLNNARENPVIVVRESVAFNWVDIQGTMVSSLHFLSQSSFLYRLNHTAPIISELYLLTHTIKKFFLPHDHRKVNTVVILNDDVSRL